LLGSLGAVFDRRDRRVALSNLRVAFGDHISSERRAQIARESGDRHLLHGRVSQKHAFDFDGKIFSPPSMTTCFGRSRIDLTNRSDFP
jgi:hypothetical protein